MKEVIKGMVNEFQEKYLPCNASERAGDATNLISQKIQIFYMNFNSTRVEVWTVPFGKGARVHTHCLELSKFSKRAFQGGG